jgi:hypothetical protein
MPRGIKGSGPAPIAGIVGTERKKRKYRRRKNKTGEAPPVAVAKNGGKKVGKQFADIVLAMPPTEVRHLVDQHIARLDRTIADATIEKEQWINYFGQTEQTEKTPAEEFVGGSRGSASVSHNASHNRSHHAAQ